MEPFDNIFSTKELATLSSIIEVGDAIYHELTNDKMSIFCHPYFWSEKGRIRTKLVQMQCEIESHEPNFPFEFREREFQYKQLIPELRNGKVILHIVRSSSQDALPYVSRYKRELSYNNERLQRQMMINQNDPKTYSLNPLYGLLTFGGRDETFSVIQFPEPGFTGIAQLIKLPRTIQGIVENESFERKKAVLKREFLSHGIKEVVS